LGRKRHVRVESRTSREEIRLSGSYERFELGFKDEGKRRNKDNLQSKNLNILTLR
jgi:hypothetical protein